MADEIGSLAARSPFVRVRGEGVVETAPDAVVIRVGVLVSMANLHLARDDAAERAAAVIAAAKEAGVLDGDIQTSGYSVNPRQDTDTKRKRPAIRSYEVRNAISLTVRDLDRLPAVLDAAISASANEVSGPHFFVQHPEDVEDEARRRAMANARRRAEVLAAAAGMALGHVRAIVDGESRGPVPRMESFALAPRSSVPATPVEPGLERITVRVEVEWDLI